jgi:hypothetical protein
MDIAWDGTTQLQTLSEEEARCRCELADAARDYKWSRVFELVSEHPELVVAHQLSPASGGVPWLPLPALRDIGSSSPRGRCS